MIDLVFRTSCGKRRLLLLTWWALTGAIFSSTVLAQSDDRKRGNVCFCCKEEPPPKLVKPFNGKQAIYEFDRVGAEKHFYDTLLPKHHRICHGRGNQLLLIDMGSRPSTPPILYPNSCIEFDTVKLSAALKCSESAYPPNTPPQDQQCNGQPNPRFKRSSTYYDGSVCRIEYRHSFVSAVFAHGADWPKAERGWFEALPSRGRQYLLFAEQLRFINICGSGLPIGVSKSTDASSIDQTKVVNGCEDIAGAAIWIDTDKLSAKTKGTYAPTSNSW